MAFSEPKHSLSILAESSIGLDELLVPLFIDRDDLTSNIDKGAPCPDSFRRALHEDAVMRVILLVVVDGKGVFIVGIEGKSAFFALLISHDRVPFS